MFRFDSFWRQHFIPAMAFLALILILGCQGRPQKKNEAQAAKPKENVTDLGTTKLTPEPLVLEIESHKTKKLLKIQRTALKKEFLLSLSYLQGGSAPTWYYLQPRIVYFELDGNRLLLNEANDFAIYDTVKLDTLVEAFPIFKEDTQSITFDLGNGFSQLSYREPWGVGRDSSNLRKNGELKTVQLHKSTITSLVQTQETIALEQAAQNMVSKASSAQESTKKYLFRLRPYRTNPNFVVVNADYDERVQYISMLAAVPGKSKAFRQIAYHWDFHASRGPVEVQVATGFPTQYEDLLVDAVQYWNRILGEEKLKIVKNVSPQSPPSERAILVRWFDHKDVGSAWAVMAADPRTGEIFNGQISVSNSWFRNFDTLGKEKSPPTDGGEQAFLKGTEVCNLKLPPITNFPIERRQEALRDRMRSTLAHELGHTLGLDHNFSASFESSVSAVDYQKSIETYLETGKSAPLATTVMDYDDMFAKAVEGAAIKSAALPYDIVAIRYTLSGGDDKELSTLKVLSCNDADIESNVKTYGCMTFDGSRNPLYSSLLRVEKLRRQIISTMFESILENMLPMGVEYSIPLEEVLNEWTQENLDSFLVNTVFLRLVSMESILTYNPENETHKELKSGSLLYSVLKKNEWQYNDYKSEMTTKKMGGDLVEAGGLSRILKALLPIYENENSIDVDFIGPQIEELVGSSRFTSGVTTTGRNYSFDSKQQEMLRRFFEIKRDYIQQRVFNIFSTRFRPTSKKMYSSLLMNNTWYPELVKTLTKLLLSSKSDSIQVVVGEKTFSLPKRILAYSVRNEIADLLDRTKMNTNAGEAELRALAEQYRAVFRPLVQALLESEKPGQTIQMPQGVKAFRDEINRLKGANKLTKEAADWLVQELNILEHIN